jgi:hypothetical protein
MGMPRDGMLDSNNRARRFYEAGGWAADGAAKLDDRPGFMLHEVRYRRVARNRAG